MKLLHDVNREGTTVIMVTHDAETTDKTRILKIRDGVIEQSKINEKVLTVPTANLI